MKNPALSLWLSSVNGAFGWWRGHAANAVRRQQRAALASALKAGPGGSAKPNSAKPKRKRRRAASGTRP